MATPHKLTLIPYLQRWDRSSRTLSLRMLVVPTVNPLEPLVAAPAGIPAFADAVFAFDVRLSDMVDALPERAAVTDSVVVPGPLSVPPTIGHPHSRTIFIAIKTALSIPDTAAADTFAPQARHSVRQIKKYLPESYRTSFAFVRPRTELAVTDDSYQCLMKCPPDPAPPRPATVIGWGEALAFALRQPRLAEALGLIVALDVVLPPKRFERGGWLWVDLAQDSDYATLAANPGFVRSFATRVPALGDTIDRDVFTPVVFPVSADATEASTLGNYDKVFVEAIRFDDGFSKIVHSRQPISSDILDESGDGGAIVRDEGVQLAWDDEDIVEGQNRSLGAPPAGEDAVIAPRGVFGYRVDVRSAGATTWSSLSMVTAPLNLGTNLGVAIEERWTEVVPTSHSGQTWLPPWYARWRGGSLVTATNEEQRLLNVMPGRQQTVLPVDADAVDLRYGAQYEFRVRLVDTTGGGPASDASTPAVGESPISRLSMKRHRPPRTAVLDPITAGVDGRVASVRVRRPRLGYPEAVFAAGPGARAKLLAQIAANDLAAPAPAIPPSIADPDALFLAIRVLVKVPTFDPLADKDGYVEWYATSRSFPSTNPDQALEISLQWIDAGDLATVDLAPQLGAEGTVIGPVMVPTARDVRLELRPMGSNDLNYFGSSAARRGLPQYLDLHTVADTAAESDVLRILPDADVCRSIFLRPDSPEGRVATAAVVTQNAPSTALLGRLAAAADLVSDGPALMGPEGQRVAFGCAGIGHYIAPDGSSIEIADPAQLAEQWINVLRFDLDRDWTWRGAGSPTLVVIRSLTQRGANTTPVTTTEVGSIELMNTINVQATRQPDRSVTRLIFVDAFPPPIAPDGLPYELEVTYSALLRLEGGSSVARSVTTQLPIVSPPRQAPVVVAAGIALTAYSHDDDYASTASRTKRLWIEFSEPLADSRDAYFVRALHSTPDPMLLTGSEPLADPTVVEGLPLDPEPIRMITPGQVNDLAGLATMQRLEPSPTSDRHFLLPLPPNTDPGSPELFAFYTYEVRVGHDRGPVTDPLWCTAQGRFGERLELEGVQHPAPELVCSVLKTADSGVAVRAPFATPYFGLKRALPTPPNTEIWSILYARVVQADAASRRNIQVDLRRLAPPKRGTEDRAGFAVEGVGGWSRADIDSALDRVGLSHSSSLGVLAVELLPEPNGGFADPLGGDLGQVRILRTSPLTGVPSECCD